MTDDPQTPTPQAPGEEFDESLKDTQFGKLKPIRITKEMQRSYLNYAMSVIVSRALPDVRDGLKPVHRRILYAMKDMGITYNTSYKKCARIVGEVLGKYHPHGDTAVYDALVRLAQDFSMRYPLIQGQGNFGSIDGDSPAAMRYTEARLAKITEELLIDIKKDTVPFEDTFDGSQQEPTVLPAKLPNLLLMGGDGIAVGMATKIPPHNLSEVIDAVTHLIKQGKADKEALSKEDQEKNIAVIEPEKLTGDFQSQSSIEELLEHINGPDFPTGGTIYDWEEIKKVYTTGKGRVVTRAKTEIIEQKGGKYQIIVTEIPYQVNKAKLIEKIADLVKQKKLEGISDLRDESDRQGLRIAIDLKRNARPKSLQNNLFKHTNLQSNYPANMVALNSEGTPQLMNLKTILTEYVRHRQLVIVRRAQYDLLSAQERAHILEGLLIALDHLDEVIDIIRNSEDADKAKERLMGNFDLSERQAVAILDMQLRRLAALERQKIQDEYQELKEQIDQLTKLLSDPKEMLKLIVTELKQIKNEYGDERRTRLIKSPLGQFSEQDLVPEEEVVVTLTKTGYIKRLPPNTYRSQRRGGKGVTGMKTKEDDVITHILMANTHDNLLVFTNRGKVFKLPVFELPATSRQAKGQAIINLINIEQGEEVQSLIAVNNKLDKIKDQYIALATKNGIIKKTAVSEFQNIRSTGIIAIVLNDGDEVVWSDLTHGKHDILIVSHQGKSIRFHESDVRSTARDTKGVKGINLKKGDYVDAVETIDTTIEPPDDKRRKFFHDLMVITENGMGKRTRIKEYPVQKRGGQGVKVANLTKKTGDVGAALTVTQDIEQILITTRKGQVIKLPLRNIPQLKRPTQGVILMRLKDKDKVVSATAVEAEDEDEE